LGVVLGSRKGGVELVADLACLLPLFQRVYPRYTTEQYVAGSEELPIKYLEGKEGRKAAIEEETVSMET
jgi:hypothetical protein